MAIKVCFALILVQKLYVLISLTRDDKPISVLTCRMPYMCVCSDDFGMHAASVRALCWDAAQSRLFSSGQDGAICVWHLQPNKEPVPIKLHLHTSAVESLSFSGRWQPWVCDACLYIPSHQKL